MAHKIITISLFIGGIIHILPLLGVMGASKLSALYQIDLTDDNLILLMRHRAVLFGLLGSFMLISIFQRHFRGVAFSAGLISVISFLLLAWITPEINSKIMTVVWVDVTALIFLITGAILHFTGSTKSA